MTILSELAALYERRAKRENWPPPGFSTEKIGAEVVLRVDGSVAAIRSLMAPDHKGKMQPRFMPVPASEKRTSGIKPNLMWDKTSYALGVTAIDGDNGMEAGQGKRTKAEHAAFRAAQIDLIGDSDDPALRAFAAFCRNWDPARYSDFPDAVALLDQNVVFALEDGRWVHDLPLFRAQPSDVGQALCLVTGRWAQPVRLHPTIKGVAGAQSSGASLVSFNNDAETSHGKSQGDNAPTSKKAAFAYGAALNALLARGSGRNLQIGDATVVFWSWAHDAEAEPEIEDAFAALFSAGDKGREAEAANENILRERLGVVAQGKMPENSALDPAAQVFILGLSPNAARISVRFWHVDTLKALAERVECFWSECAIAPSPFRYGDAERLPKPAALLYDIAVLRDRKNIPPNLAGDLMRAILTGLSYPATLLPAVIGRLRAEGEPDRKYGAVDGRRAALIRAILIRNLERKVPMSLSETNHDIAYLLGRLFGAYVYAERSYQERVAPLRSKYMGSASATPARIFPVLMRGYEHNLDALRKAGGKKAGAGIRADKAVAAILNKMPDGALPATLPLEDQGHFFIGFYHQLSAFYAKPEEAAVCQPETADEGEQA